MAWGRAYIYDQALLDAVAKEIIAKHNQKIFYEAEATAEIVNIV
jgi:hypothetical protein